MSNDYPLVSIIIPTYNSSDYITETLTKLEKQTYPNFEIVIVNDGSKDNTSNVLREYGLTHSRLIIINKENGGVSSARNTGIRKAQGQFICFMDDDDEIDPNYLLKKRIKWKNRHIHYSVDFFHTYYAAIISPAPVRHNKVFFGFTCLNKYIIRINNISYKRE